MGRELWAGCAPARAILEKAERLTGKPLGRYCLSGPADLLTRTDNLQPAITAVNLGCAVMLQEAGFQADFVAGHSLGEFSALFAAGVLEAEDVLRLVIERGRLMHECAARVDGVMAVIRLGGVAVEQLIVSMPGTDVCVANYNGPAQAVVSGVREDVRELCARAAAHGADSVELAVAGPWHSGWMRDAAASFRDVLDAFPFRIARCPVFLNATAEPETDPGRIRQAIVAQMTSPVRWEQAIRAILGAGTAAFLEVGPGKVLRGLLRGICPDPTLYSIRTVDCPRVLPLANVADLVVT
jgi:[acyl-carrier-protein] S-malonyltransferase